jgi:zinc transport system substrate-binding protein
LKLFNEVSFARLFKGPKFKVSNTVSKTTLFVLLCTVIAVFGCRGHQEDGVLVAVSVNPLVSMASAVGGDRVEVVRLVPPGASPHTYELMPSQVAMIGRADLVVLVGLGFEFWAEDLLSATRSGNGERLVIHLSDTVEPIDANPHIWLDPVSAVSQVELIRDALVELDPGGAPVYAENAAIFVGELQDLDRELANEIGTWSQRSFIAFHPAWIYFATRYGLVQAAVVEETPGREPSPAELAGIIDTARRIGARAVFAEPQLPPGIAETLAEESGATVLFLDPLGGSTAPSDYLGLIRYNVRTMAEAMK